MQGVASPAAVRERPSVAAARDHPLLVATLVCAALAAISAGVLPTVPSYDPWSWVVWGREVFDPHLSFFVGGGPSWKPLPVAFTAVFGLFGGAAPTLWVIAARTGGLLGVVAAYRLASRLVGERHWAIVAGLIAAVGVVLTQDWAYYLLRGTSEPMLIGTSPRATVRRGAAPRRRPAGPPGADPGGRRRRAVAAGRRAPGALADAPAA